MISPHSTPVATTLPDPRAWATAFVRAVGETMVGRRPPGALSAFISAEVREVLHRRRVPGPRDGRPAARNIQIGRVHVRRVAHNVVEANAVLLRPDGGQAVAFRMEGRRDRWVCTAWETRGPAHVRSSGREQCPP